MGDASWIGQFGKELERIFRYLLPGIVIIGFARLSHPSWFCWVQLDSSQHLVLLTGIALAVGCVWYVLHRYTIHQLIDWVNYRCKFKECDYRKWLTSHISDSFRRDEGKGLQEYIRLRSAQIISMFMIAEALLSFSLFCPEECSFFRDHKWWLFGIGAVILVSAFIQQRLQFQIDLHAVKTSSKSNDKT